MRYYGFLRKESGGDWNLTFYVTAGVYVLGACCWWFLDPVTPLEEQGRPRSR